MLNRIDSLRGSKTIQWDKYGENLKIILFIEPKSSKVTIIFDQSNFFLDLYFSYQVVEN